MKTSEIGIREQITNALVYEGLLMYQRNVNRYIKIMRNNSLDLPHLMNIIILVLLCMMAMNFLNRIFFIAVFVFFLVAIIRFKNFDLHWCVFPTMVLAISMCLFAPNNHGDTFGSIRTIIYPMCVLTGFNLIDSESKEKAELQIVLIILALAVGAYGHFLLNMLFNAEKSSTRNVIDYWTASVFSATGQSTMACMMLGITVSVLFLEMRFVLKVIASLVLMSIIYYNLFLGGRTIFLLIIIVFAINLLAKLLFMRYLEEKVRAMILLIIMIGLLVLVFQSNLFNIRETITNSTFFMRFLGKNSVEGLGEDNRVQYKLLYIRNMLSYPFGGNELRMAIGGNYAHDLLLDSYSNAGIIAGIAIFSILISTIIQGVRLCMNRLITRSTKILVMSVLFPVYIIFFLEPVLEGMPWLFASFCVMYGSLTKLLELKNDNGLYLQKHI